MSQRKTFTAQSEHEDKIEQLQRCPEISSQSDAIRYALEAVGEENAQLQALQDEIDDLEQQLQQQKAKADARVQEIELQYEQEIDDYESQLAESDDEQIRRENEIERLEAVVEFLSEQLNFAIQFVTRI